MKLLACLVVLLFSAAPAFAHSCATYKNLPVEEHRAKLREMNAIFEGEILFVEEIAEQSYLIKLKVLRVWKGDQVSEITIKYANPCSNLKLGNEMIGGRWLIYGLYLDGAEPYLQVNCCSPFDDDKMKQEFGEGFAIEHPAPQTPAAEEGFGAWIWRKITSLFS